MNHSNFDRRRSLVLLSGGLDSSANLAMCKDYDEPVLALTVDYGQKAAAAEIRAAKAISEYYQVKHRVLDMKWLGACGSSGLTSESSTIPKVKTSELDELEVTKESAKKVWVPNRNGLLINAAAAIAEGEQIRQVVVGFNKEEAATFPDNSSQFLQVVTLSLRYSTSNGVKVACYTDLLDKREIVGALRKLSVKFPFEKVWSCYYGGDVQCQECESCRRYQRAVSTESV